MAKLFKLEVRMEMHTYFCSG